MFISFLGFGFASPVGANAIIFPGLDKLHSNI